MLIYGGGKVRTGPASSARLELLEGIVRLSADTIFTVKESVARQNKLVTKLALDEGRLWAHLTSDQPHEFTVETANAVAAVRDTDFSVQVFNGATLVSVMSGEVEMPIATPTPTLPTTTSTPAPPTTTPTSISSPTAPGEVEVVWEDNGRQIDLVIGQTLVVKLLSNPSTGYEWEVSEIESTILQQVGEKEFQPDPGAPANTVGAGGSEIFRFEATSVGQTPLGLIYRRPWEVGVDPLETYALQVVVR